MDEEVQPKRKWTFLNTWKDVVAVLRDTFLLALVVLLLAFPETFNGLLVNAGFEEGSIVGFKWKAKLVESDQALKEAQANITDLTTQNEKLSKELAGAQAKTNDPTEKIRLANLEEENKKLKRASVKVKASVQDTIDSSAALVEKAQTTMETNAQWGVVYGGETNLKAVKNKALEAEQQQGITNTSIFYRQGSFRSVAIASNYLEAMQLLIKAKIHRSDAYIVNMSKWCPRTQQKDGYAECTNS